jgi:hypothetical protein
MTKHFESCCAAIAILLFLLIAQIKDWLLGRRLHEV